MTTIVASIAHGGMAADTRVTGAMVYYPASKLFRVGESIFGTSGHGDMCLAFIHWVKTSPKRDPMKLHELIGKEYDRDDISILELNPSGIFRWTGWGFPEHVLREADAVGSGAQAALEALNCGKGLEESVSRAMNHDEYTGCEVQVLYLDEPGASTKKRTTRK